MEAKETYKYVYTVQRWEPGSIHGTEAVPFCSKSRNHLLSSKQNRMGQLPEVPGTHLKQIPGLIEPVSNRSSYIERMFL